MKPVAYISEGGILFKESPPDSMIKLTPLYAMRELTNEEIDELANKYLYVLNDIPYANDIKDFSRAILQKASEQ